MDISDEAADPHWFIEGVESGHRFLIIWQDNFNATDDDLGLYPEYVNDVDGGRLALKNGSSNALQKVMEILDLSGNYAQQVDGLPRTTLEEP